MTCVECETNAGLFIGMVVDIRRTHGWPSDDAAPLPAAWWHNNKGDMS